MIRALCLALVAFTAAAACSREPAGHDLASGKPAPAPPLKVETGTVTVEKVPHYLTLTGTVAADRQSEVAANVAGRVISTFVERGQSVNEGQVLAIVDSKGAALSASAAGSQAQAAQSQVALAQQECDRADTLFGQGAIARSEFDRLKTQCTAQLHSANAARANADLAAKLAGDAVIRAPIKGIVGERYVSVGEYVQPMTRVASLYSVNPARVLISVPEPAVGRVRQGQALEVEVTAYPGRQFPAVVKYLGAALRPTTRDLIIEATVKNDDGTLRPGMFATVQLTADEDELATVPTRAVAADGTVRRIFLARAGQAYEVVVQTGVTFRDRVAVYEKLSPGEAVILSPPPTLRDGAAIQ
jgi:membrane fusion protein (multidrug efflux system)